MKARAGLTALAAISTKSKNNITSVPLDSVVIDEAQDRSPIDVNDDDFKALVRSVEHTKGVQSPVDVVALDNDKYRLVAGERRVRAALELGLSSVPAVVWPKGTDEKILNQRRFIENVTREDLPPLDYAQAIQSRLDQGESLDEISIYLGKTLRHLQNRMVLINYPAVVKDLLVSKKIDGLNAATKANALYKNNKPQFNELVKMLDAGRAFSEAYDSLFLRDAGGVPDKDEQSSVDIDTPDPDTGEIGQVSDGPRRVKFSMTVEAIKSLLDTIRPRYKPHNDLSDADAIDLFKKVINKREAISK